MNKRRVVITGLGSVTAFGQQVEPMWQKLLAGESGISPIDRYECSGMATQFAGTIKEFDVSGCLNQKDAKKYDLFIQYGLVASDGAIKDAGLDLSTVDRTRVGTFIGSGIGGISRISEQHQVMLERGTRKISPFFVTGSISNMVSGLVSIHFGLQGPSYAMVTACTTGTHSLGLSARMIQYGDADVMIAGGAEYGSCKLGLSAFIAARALSKRNDDPCGASRPWDKDRDGFVLADGAGVLVLEEYEHARARGAKIYAEVLGFGASSDAHHITAPPQDGQGAALAMSNAIRDANITPADVGYINAHGTSTVAGDIAEVNAVKSVFGNAANDVMISSTKSMMGHMLGAAGAVEAVITTLALRDQRVPPTINLENPDEGCDLDFVPYEARNTELEVAMSNSFGFGGTNGCLVLRRWT